MRRIERATVITHGVTKNVNQAVCGSARSRRQAGCELRFDDGPVRQRSQSYRGDGTMLRALTRFLDTGVP